MGLDDAMAWQARWRSYIERHPRTAACCIVVLAVLVGGFDLSRLVRARSTLPGSEWLTGVADGAIAGIVVLAVAGLCWLLGRRLINRWPGWAPPVVALVFLAAFVGTHPRHGPDTIRDVGHVASVTAVDVIFLAILGYAAVRRWRTPAVTAGPRQPIEA
jgi:hypothetical protein